MSFPQDPEVSGGRAAACCFTGHRDIPKVEYRKISENVCRLVQTLYQIGVRDFYAGGALGFDMIASVTVLNLKAQLPDIRLILALPCRNHTARWKKSEKELFERVLARADEAVYVSEKYFRACMQMRNRYMVDRSRICVCYYEGKSGGTRNTVAYAAKQGLSIYNLYIPQQETLPEDGDFRE